MGTFFVASTPLHCTKTYTHELTTKQNSVLKKIIFLHPKIFIIF